MKFKYKFHRFFLTAPLTALLAMLVLPLCAFAQLPTSSGWSDLPSTQFQSVCPPNNYAGSGYNYNSQCFQVMAAWNSAVMDTKRDHLMVWGGGHGDYSGNEMYVADLNTLTIARVTNPGQPPIVGGTVCPEALADGTPNSRHTYDGLNYMPNVDKMLVFGGYLTCGPGAESTSTWIFDPATLTWTNRNPTGSPPTAVLGVMTSYDPNTGKVFANDTGDMFVYDYNANTWTHLGSAQLPNGTNSRTISIVDPVRRRFYMFGCSNVNACTPGAWYVDISPGSSYTLNTLSTTGGDALISQIYPGIAYDPISDRIVGWNGGNTVYSFNMDTNVWTPTTVTGGPGAAQVNGTLKRWAFSPKDGAFIVANAMGQDLFSYRVSGENPAKTSLTISATTTGTSQYSLGLVFKKGDYTSTPALSIPGQVIVKRTWNDGSVKTAVASGEFGTFANTAQTVQVLPNSAASGTNLTASDIQVAAPTASIQCGSIGTVNLSSLLATPFRTWISGPNMVEAHYLASVGSDPTLVATFQVRLYKSGKIWVRAIVENGYLDVSTSNKSYVPTIIIGGATVYNNGGSTLLHYAHTRYMAEGWIGTSDPGVSWFQDLTYLDSTLLVPNYNWRNPNSSGLTQFDTDYPNGSFESYVRTYTPMLRGNISATMSNPGYQADIGLLPLWDAMYATTGDANMQKTVLANAASLGSYGIVWRDSSTHLVAKPSVYPTYAIGGGTYDVFTQYDWEFNHVPLEAYLAYLITGDYFYYETLLMHVSTEYLALGSGNVGSIPRGNGTSRLIIGQTRGTGWALRDYSALAAIFPTGDVVATEYQTILNNNIDYWFGVSSGLSSGLGYLYEYSLQVYGPTGVIAPWQQHFMIQAAGFGNGLEPLSSMTHYISVNSWLGQAAVGILGPSSGFCFNYGSSYNIKISNSLSQDPSTFYPDWATVWSNSILLTTQWTNEGTNSEQGDGARTTFHGILTQIPVNPGTITLTIGSVNATDDGAGNLHGTGVVSGTVSYSTGVFTITYTVPPSVGLVVSATYQGAVINNQGCNNTLKGTSGSDPAEAAGGYWGNLMPAIALAVDAGVSGASASWSRLTGADNWSTVNTSGFDNVPQFGIVPRNTSPSPASFTISKTGPSSAPTNSTALYQIGLGNGGATTSGTSVTIADQLPSGTVANNCIAGSGVASISSCTNTGVAGALVVVTLTLSTGLSGGAPNGSAIITLNTTMPSSPTSIVNYTSVDATGGASPPTPGPSCTSSNCGSQSTTVFTLSPHASIPRLKKP